MELTLLRNNPFDKVTAHRNMEKLSKQTADQPDVHKVPTFHNPFKIPKMMSEEEKLGINSKSKQDFENKDIGNTTPKSKHKDGDESDDGEIQIDLTNKSLSKPKFKQSENDNQVFKSEVKELKIDTRAYDYGHVYIEKDPNNTQNQHILTFRDSIGRIRLYAYITTQTKIKLDGCKVIMKTIHTDLETQQPGVVKCHFNM